MTFSLVAASVSIALACDVEKPPPCRLDDPGFYGRWVVEQLQVPAEDNAFIKLWEDNQALGDEVAAAQRRLRALPSSYETRRALLDDPRPWTAEEYPALAKWVAAHEKSIQRYQEVADLPRMVPVLRPEEVGWDLAWPLSNWSHDIVSAVLLGAWRGNERDPQEFMRLHDLALKLSDQLVRNPVGLDQRSVERIRSWTQRSLLAGLRHGVITRATVRQYASERMAREETDRREQFACALRRGEAICYAGLAELCEPGLLWGLRYDRKAVEKRNELISLLTPSGPKNPALSPAQVQAIYDTSPQEACEGLTKFFRVLASFLQDTYEPDVPDAANAVREAFFKKYPVLVLVASGLHGE
jgi:hypothetical protein